MIELEAGYRSRLTKIIHGIHHLPDIKYSPRREHLVIRFHDSLRRNADEYVVLICKGREIGVQGKAKWQRTSTFIVYLVGYGQFSPGERIRQGQPAIERVTCIVRTFSIDIYIGGDAYCIWTNDRLSILPGSIKDQTVNERGIVSWPLYIFKRIHLSLIGVALVTYSVRKRPEDKVTSIVLIFEEDLVSVHKIMLTDTKTVHIAAEL